MVDRPAPHPGLDAVRSLAFGAGDGAYAWKKEALPVVFRVLTAEGLAVVGGEVWGIRDFEIFGAVPTRRGHTHVFAWSAPDRHPGVEWPSYVAQCADHAHQAVRRLNAEAEVIPAFRDRLVYHLHFFDEKNYPPPR